MGKKITIYLKGCKDCPNLKLSPQSYYYCNHTYLSIDTNLNNKAIKDLDDFPLWCPLEDY